MSVSLYKPKHRLEVHIHQGGTQNAYCGIPLDLSVTIVAWEDAARSTCSGCSAHFPVS
jgi:hypothetical protein